jgi:UDP-N-acetylglucosamine--N-acetylmuramyl-(pentapeptide) pyrophosphoryl-undecaprenol N-acetylglucosamine transferase
VTQRHLVVMAAGTGGHVIPGLAVAREMQSRGWSVSWLGTRSGMENRLVPPTGIALDAISFSGVRGKGFVDTLTGGLRLLGAFWSCLKILRRRRADAVLGMGGYVCFPGGMMASLLGQPLFLVNADATLLLSNKLLLPLADGVAFGFEGALPVPTQRFAGRAGELRLLVVGGSLGAKVLNESVPQALALLTQAQRPQVMHQTGAAQYDTVRALYQRLEVRVDVAPFIDDMANELARCDVMICRAGAVTVSELCAAGVAAVLVPLIVSTTSHQRDNAQWLASHGAGIHVPQSELTPRTLADLLAGLTRERLLVIAEKARSLGRPRAAARVADELERLAPA